MTVRDDMVNGHAIGHGGFIFTLADSAFALACNSRSGAPWPRRRHHLPAPDLRSATSWWHAVERDRDGRGGLRRHGDRGRGVVAEFGGRSREIGGRVLVTER